MLLHTMKSIADYLRNTSSIDMLTHGSDDQNLAMLDDATLVVQSSAVTQRPSAVLLDGSLLLPYHFNYSNGDPPYIGCTWATEKSVDGLRFFVGTVGANAPMHWKLQTYDDVMWNDEDGSPITTIAGFAQWCTMRLQQRQRVFGIRAIRTDALTFLGLSVSELDVRERMDTVYRPACWPDDSNVVVCTNTTDLSDRSIDDPLITVSSVDITAEDSEIGGFGKIERTVVYVGVHAASEDMQDQLARWVRLVLESAQAATQDGSITTSAIPLRAFSYPLVYSGESVPWWTSGQHDWLTSPAPVVYAGGNVIAPDAIDYGRGRVKYAASANTDMRADFTVGAFEFEVAAVVRTVAGEVAQVQHLHNVYLSLESSMQVRDTANTLL